jgi:hypothetical protein
MLYIRADIFGEYLGGVIPRYLFTGRYGPYSESWYRKTMLSGSVLLDVRKIKKKIINAHLEAFPAVHDHLSGLDVDAAHEYALPPDLNVELIESMEEGVAPLVAYFSRDITRPFEIGKLEDSESYLAELLKAFPYCYWWQVSEYTFKSGMSSVDVGIDGCLAFFACMFIDAELSINLDEAIDEILLPAVHLNYSPNYGVSNYVDYKLEWLKRSPKYSLEMFYQSWSEWDGESDRDSIEKLLKRWRSGKVTPRSERFGDLVYFFGGTSQRSFCSECEVVGLFLTVQLIQRYRKSTGGDSELLRSP